MAAARLLQARQDGATWPEVTRAVADGVNDRFGFVPITPASRQTPTALIVLLGALLVYVLLRPLLGLGHELVVAGIAWLLHTLVQSMVWEPVVGWSGLDPIYAGAAIRAAGGVEVEGLAIGGALGSTLHALLPTVFLAADQLAEGAGVSMVAAPGSPAIGRALAAFGADVVWLAIGIWLFTRWRRESLGAAFLGLLILAQISINQLLDAHVSVADLEASGLPFALALALDGEQWFTTVLAGQSAAVQQALIGGSLLLLAYLAAVLVLVLVSAPARLARAWRPTVYRPARERAWGNQRLIVCMLVLSMLIAASPVGALAVGEPNWQELGTFGSPQQVAQWRRLPVAPRVAGPTEVRIQADEHGSWSYLVDGRPEVIRGVGYNPQYSGLSRAERTRLYQRDFNAMSQLGVNTIEGWFEPQFDDVTLDAAAQHGIGVIMPFEINHDWDITNPAMRAGILERLSAYVERSKHHPAVRMWAPGNENLHRILYPRWVSQEHNPEARARADAFAAFLPEVVDRIHELDPNHPVVYRDAEDLYLGRVRAAFDATGQDRPWLVYGANVYSDGRLSEIINAWPNQWPGRPLLISEFAPAGAAAADRSQGFQQQWLLIRSRPGLVLGGLAYAWATNGPEELDRVFGLVDAAGAPTDSALAGLSSAYVADLASAATPPAPR